MNLVGRREPPNLFRAAALSAARDPSARPSGLTPPASTWFAVLGLVGLAVLGLIAFEVEFPRRIQVAGQLLPEGGRVAVVAVRPSQVASVHVARGDVVPSGAALVTLNRERQAANEDATGFFASHLSFMQKMGAAENDAAAAEDQRAGVIKSQLETELLAAEQQFASQRRARRALVQQIAAAEGRLEALEKLVARGLAARFNLLGERSDVSGLQVQLARLDGELALRRASVRRRQDELTQWVQTQRARKARDEVRRAAHERQMLELQDGRAETLHAPVAARVVGITRKQGEFAAAGETLVMLERTGERLEARLYVPSRGLGELAEGQIARLRFDAYPIERFGLARGVVKDLADVPVAAVEGKTLSAGEALFEVKVSLPEQSLMAEGSRWPLRSGMTLAADILVERQTLVNRLLRPLRSTP